jgi:hypothetical protein
MPIVQMPDGALVDMPDNPSPEQLAALQSLQSTGPIKEIGRVADQSLRRGVAGAVGGFAGDVALSGTKQLKGAPAVPMQAATTNPFLAIMRALQEVSKADAVQGSKFGDVTNAVATAGGALPPVQLPKTNVGKAAGNVGESLVGAMAGGGLTGIGQRAAVGAGAGLGGEIGARATDDSPMGRILGALFGGGGVALGQVMRPNAEQLIKQSTAGMTPSDWRKAQVLDKLMERQGLPRLKSQLLGERSTLDDVVADATANPQVKPKVVTAMAGAPGKAQQIADDALDEHLAINVGGRQQALDDVQAAAGNRLKELKGKANEEFVKVMPKEGLAYDQGKIKGLYEELLALAKSSKYGETTDAGKAIRRYAEDLVEKRVPGVPGEGLNPVVAARLLKAGKPLPAGPEQLEFVTDAHKVNNLIKELNAKAYSPDYRGLPLADVKRLMVSATPEFDSARAAKRSFIEREVNPRQKSLLGQIAGMGGGAKPDKVTANETAINWMFNKGPRGQEIETLAKEIGPDNVALMLREHLKKAVETKFGADTARIEGRIAAPARLVDEIAGAPWKRQNIDAALKVWAEANKQNPKDVQKGFYRLVESFESFKDAKIAGGVSPGMTAAVAGKNVPGALAEPFGTARRVFGARATTKTYQQIADIVISPDGLERLKAIAQQPDPQRARAMALGVMAQAVQAHEENE